MRAIVLVFAGGVAACAAAPQSRPVVEFPSTEKLATLQAKPAQSPVIQSGALPRDGWAVEAAHASRATGEAWTPEGVVEGALAETASSSDARLTRAMSCVARQVGRYQLTARAAPPHALLTFAAGACGSVWPHVGSEWLTGEVPAAVTDAALLERWRDQLRSVLLAKLPKGASEAGFWFGREGGRAVAVMAYATAQADLAPLSLHPNADGDIVVDGQLRGGADYVAGYVNHGRHGVASCAVDPSIHRPRFRVTCPVAPEDETAWVQVVYAPPKSVLGFPVVQLLARRTPDAALAYTAPGYGQPRDVGTGEEFAGVALQQLNAVRAQAQLPAVRLAREQSGAAAGLAGHYFSAAYDGARADDMNTIALGLLAGWHVRGMIRDATFLSSVVPFTRDAGRWLDEALSLPLGRTALLAPEIEEVAFGPTLFGQPQSLGAVVTGYRLHHGNDHTKDVARLYMRLRGARKRLALQSAQRLPGVAEIMREELAAVHAGTAQPFEALEAVLARSAERFGGMRGWVVEAASLDALEIPEEVVRQTALHMEIGVTHHKPKGAAWAQLVILVVFIDYSGDGA